jgi:hypothetical protein
MTTYKEVFQLAQERGYKFKYPTCQVFVEGEPELLELTLIQKWLRDEHKILVLIDCVSVGELFQPCIKWHKDAHREQYGSGYTTYEEALLQGIAEALKLI